MKTATLESEIWQYIPTAESLRHTSTNFRKSNIWQYQLQNFIDLNVPTLESFRYDSTNAQKGLAMTVPTLESLRYDSTNFWKSCIWQYLL